MKKDNFRLVLMAILTFTLLAGIGTYAYTMVMEKEAAPWNILSIIIALLLVIFMVFFIVRRFRDVKAGMPFEDERSKQVMTRTAATSFYIAFYWLLFISMFEPLFAKMFGAETLTASQTVGGGIAGMAIAFFLCWFYYNKKGKLT